MAASEETVGSLSIVRPTWSSIVASYTARSFSVPEDREVALQGALDLFQAQGSAMTFGSWQASFDAPQLESLLWYVDRQPTVHSERGQRHASWSWMSVDGSINNDSVSMISAEASTFHFNALEVWQPDLLEEDVFDKFAHLLPTGIGLRCTATIAVAHWRAQPGQYYLARNAPNASSRTAGDSRDLFHGDWNLFPHTEGFVNMANDIRIAQACAEFYPISENQDEGPTAHTLLDVGGQSVGWLIPDRLEDLPDEIHCLRIVAARRSQPAQVTRGLALRRICDSVDAENAPAMYQRVGYFELEGDSYHLGSVLRVTPEIQNMLPRVLWDGERSRDLDPHRLFERHGRMEELIIV